jgi:hypothetical protein
MKVGKYDSGGSERQFAGRYIAWGKFSDETVMLCHRGAMR